MAVAEHRSDRRTPRPVVLVGVDGSDASATALTWAAREAQQRGGELEILYVGYTPVVSSPYAGVAYVPPLEEIAEYGAGVLAAAARSAARVASNIPVRTVMRTGHPVEILLAAAQDVTLVVLGTRGLGTVGSLVLGSVSTRLAARCAVPLVVVPPGDRDAGPGGRVVVGVDGSPHADAALRFALDEAARRDSRLLAVTAYTLPVGPLWLENPLFYGDVTRVAREEGAATVKESLLRVETPEHDRVVVDTAVLEGSPAQVILEAGRGAALTVVGSRGRSEIRGMLLGSVSQTVLHRADHPVAVVHAPATTAAVDAA